MHNSPVKIIVGFLVCLLIGTALVRAQDESKKSDSTKKEISELLQTQVDCWNQEDLKGFMATYWNSENLTFSSGGQTTRGWKATFARYQKRYQSGDAEMGKLRFEKLEIEMLSDDACYVLGKWFLTMKKSKPHGNFSLVMKKIDGAWKIVHDHSSSLEKK